MGHGRRGCVWVGEVRLRDFVCSGVGRGKGDDVVVLG